MSTEITANVKRKSYMRYRCYYCGRYAIYDHVIEMQGRARQFLWNSQEETEKKAIKKAIKYIDELENTIYDEVNRMHNYGHFHSDVYCPYCGEHQPWSRGRGKKELEILSSPDFEHAVYYNHTNMDDLKKLLEEEKKRGDAKSAPEKVAGQTEKEVRAASRPEENEKVENHHKSHDNSEAMPFTVSPAGRIRYDIEHRLLRDHFFHEREKTIKLITADNGLYTLYKKSFELAGVPFPYRPEDFHVTSSRRGKKLTIYSMELPDPEYVPLCHRIHLFVENDGLLSRYFTVERGVTGGFLCGWDPQGTHLNYSPSMYPKWSPGERAFQLEMEINSFLDCL